MSRKSAKAQRTFRIRCYRVNGMMEIPVEAVTAKAAREQACKDVAAGVRMQPGGPTLFFADCRETHFIAVVAGEETPSNWP